MEHCAKVARLDHDLAAPDPRGYRYKLCDECNHEFECALAGDSNTQYQAVKLRMRGRANHRRCIHAYHTTCQH